jgi:hypothetical protein
VPWEASEINDRLKTIMDEFGALNASFRRGRLPPRMRPPL